MDSTSTYMTTGAVSRDAVDLACGRVEFKGTKSRTSHRTVTLPTWLAERMRERAAWISTGLFDAYSEHNQRW